MTRNGNGTRVKSTQVGGHVTLYCPRCGMVTVALERPEDAVRVIEQHAQQTPRGEHRVPFAIVSEEGA